MQALLKLSSRIDAFTRWTGKRIAWLIVLAVIMVLGVVSLYTVMRLGATAATPVAADSSAPVTFADVRSVIDRRCTVCHSAHPSDLSFGAAPGGVKFDTPKEIEAWAARIHERAVVTRTMPPANRTAITAAERALLGRWAAGR